MSFLAPLFFFGALAIALPVLFHLIRRSVRERTTFSSLMFLSPSPPRLTRRSRLEHRLLLTLRCAVLCLLAVGFARPFLKRAFPQTPVAAPAQRVLVLLDTSASMRRQELWRAARAKAEAIASEARPADAIALFTFDRQLKSLVTFNEWSQTAAGDRLSVARNRLADVQPGWGRTALDSALTQAAELLEDRTKDEFTGLRQIVVISDFQEGCRLAALPGYHWPAGVQVVQERIVPRPANNASLQLLTDPISSITAEPSIRVRVGNASDSKCEQFRVGWAGVKDAYLGKPVDVYVPVGQSRVVSMATPPTNLPASRILLTGDDEPFDNVVWIAPPEKSRMNVIYLGDDLEGDARQPLFFLQRALQDTARQAIHIVRAGPSALLSQAQVDGAGLFVITTTIDDAKAALCRKALSQGKTLLVVPPTAHAAASLGKVLNVEMLQASEQKPDGYAMLADIEFGHPLFAPFADSRFSDFTKLHFWSYRKMDFSAFTNAQTLARFDTGDPAIVSIPAGNGRVFVLTSGWHPADSQLALSSKFVPLLYSMIELSGAAPPPPAEHFVGAALSVAQLVLDTTGPLTIQLPDGSTLALKPGETNFAALEPGIYLAVSSRGTTRFAVNLDPVESRTAPLPGDELERLGVPGPGTSPLVSGDTGKTVRLQNAESEARQKLWRWFIVATLAVLGLETWLAGRTARRAAPREELS